jgi:hypothetical protein
MMKYLAIGHSKAKLEFTAGTNFTSDDDPAEIFPFQPRMTPIKVHASKPARCYFSLLAKAARAPL